MTKSQHKLGMTMYELGTQQLIRQLADTAQQVIVLSHDSRFLRLLWEGYPQADIRVLQMCRFGDNTVIGEWDIEAETQSTYLSVPIFPDTFSRMNGSETSSAKSGMLPVRMAYLTRKQTCLKSRP